METELIYHADLGLIGWIIVIVIGTVIMGLFNKKKKDSEDKDSN